MNLFITQEELASHKHINFSVDLDASGLLISSCPQGVSAQSQIITPSTELLTDLNHLSWQELNAIGKSGKARQQIALGAVKTDHMKNGYKAEYRIVGFDHDDLADGSGKAPFTWLMTRIYKESRPMNNDSTNKGGWDGCELREWLNSEFFALCSDDLQSVICPVIKLTSAGSKSKEIIKSADRIFIPSEKEIFGRAVYSVPGEGHWYEYFRQEDVPYIVLDEDGTAVWWWLRSADYAGSGYFCSVRTDGGYNYYIASWSAGVVPGFSF